MEKQHPSNPSPNPTALITGASRGIGRGIALALAQVGFDLVINYAGNQAAAEETAQHCCEAAQTLGHSIRALPAKADIGNPKDRQHLIQFSQTHFPSLTLLVNNAGITSIGRADLLEATEENFDKLFATNLKGPYFLTQLAAKWMLQTPPPSHRPKILFVSSISGYTVSTNRGDYCLAKAALKMMTQLYAVRLADHGIHVHEISPGIIASDMTAPVREKYDALIDQGLTPIRRWGQPDDIGKAVVALATDAFPFSTGDTFHIDGGFHLRKL